MTSPQSYEVIVLGGGKGGKTLATELGNKSVTMALIERSAEPGVQLLDMPDFSARKRSRNSRPPRASGL